MARFTLHGMWLSGPCYKVGLMLGVTGHPFDYVHVDLAAGEQHGAPFLGRNRFGKVPVLEDHEAGISLCESSVILQYLAEVTGMLGGVNYQENLRAREWQSWAVMTLALPIYRARAAQLGFFEFPMAVTQANIANAKDNLGALDQLIGDSNWLVGNQVTIADIELYAIVGYAPQAGIPLEPWANITRWMGQMTGVAGFLPIETGLPKQSAAA